jgi:DNA-binding beta-propeller fold protein YncE
VTALLVLVGVASCGGSAPPAPALPLRFVVDVPLTGGSSRFDYQSLAGTSLYIAHLGDDAVIVFDVGRREVLRTVEGLPGVHGVLAVPELGRVFASATDADELVTLDGESGRVLARARTGDFPDGLAYDPGSRRVFVSDKLGKTVTVVDATTGKRLGAVAVGSELGNVRYDSGSGFILANAQSTGEIVAIDPQALEIVGRIATPGCDENHGLLVDALRRRAFVACEQNAKLLVVDLDERTVSSTFSVGEAPDVLAFDGALGRLYVASESGVVSLFAAGDGVVEKLGEGRLAPSAHSVAVDPATHLVYFPLEEIEGQPVLRIMAPLDIAD